MIDLIDEERDLLPLTAALYPVLYLMALPGEDKERLKRISRKIGDPFPEEARRVIDGIMARTANVLHEKSLAEIAKEGVPGCSGMNIPDGLTSILNPIEACPGFVNLFVEMARRCVAVGDVGGASLLLGKVATVPATVQSYLERVVQDAFTDLMKDSKSGAALGRVLAAIETSFVLPAKVSGQLFSGEKGGLESIWDKRDELELNAKDCDRIEALLKKLDGKLEEARKAK